MPSNSVSPLPTAWSTIESPVSSSVTSNTSTSHPKAPNPAKDAFRLLDILHEVKHVSSAIREFQRLNAKDLKDASVKHLGVMTEALDILFADGCREVVKISPVTHLQRAYDKYKAGQRKRERENPIRSEGKSPVHGLRGFIKRRKKSHSDATEQPLLPLPAVCEEPRSSMRGERKNLTAKEMHASTLAKFHGRPPEGARVWTSLALCLFMDDLKSNKMPTKPYLEKIIKRGMTSYKDYTSIQRAH